jgi:NADP-dependent 3-hydroxy acid dehydrogenase YdfG
MKEGFHTELDTRLFDYGPESVNGKNILITGGTTGIGRSMAVLLATQGAQVMIMGRHEQELKDAIQDIQTTGGAVSGFTAEGQYKDWQYIVNTNMLGYMAMAHEAIEGMKPNSWGHIINIGSMSADVREKDSSVYVATKAGIAGFSESLRREVNPLGIKVTLIEPGAVGTDMQPEPPEEQRSKQENMELPKSEDIAACVLYALTQPKRCDVVMVQIRPHLQPI